LDCIVTLLSVPTSLAGRDLAVNVAGSAVSLGQPQPKPIKLPLHYYGTLSLWSMF
jgi:hypothetical protein